MHEDQKSIHKLSFTTNDHSRSKHQVCIRYTARHKIPHVVSRSRSDSTISYRKHDDVADALKHLEAGSGGALCTGRHAFHMLFLRVKTRCACPGHRLHIPHLVISVAARVISAPQQASQWNIFSSILFFTARLATKLDPQSVSLSSSFLLLDTFISLLQLSKYLSARIARHVCWYNSNSSRAQALDGRAYLYLTGSCWSWLHSTKAQAYCHWFWCSRHQSCRV